MKGLHVVAQVALALLLCLPVSAISMEEYIQVRTGMTLQEVADIAGYLWEPVSESEIGDLKTELLEWRNDDGSAMSLILQNGEVVSKSQYGLKWLPPKKGQKRK